MLSYFAGEQNACRTTPFAVTLNAPPRGKEENCENGGLEYGTFQNWTGGVGTYATNTISIPNNDIEANIRHTIIASDPNKFDPYVGNLFPLVTPDGGTYIRNTS